MAAKKKSSKSKASKRTPSRAKKATANKATARKAATSKAAAKKAPARASAGTKARSGKRGASDPVDEVQRVIDVMVERGAVEVELEQPGFKMRVRLKDDTGATVVSMPQASFSPAPVVQAQPSVGADASATSAGASAGSGEVFTSPMVGTFYQSPSPEASPFVDVGDRIGPDTTVCILEAMKVMNEIQTELSGTITEILVKNGDPVEYGQPLFVIDAD